MGAPFRSGISDIPGVYIVAAMDTLPPCGPDMAAQAVEIDASVWGRFRITFVPFRHTPRGRPTTWLWLPKEAERLDAGA